MMQTVGQNDYLLEQIYTLMANQVVGPISLMVNELNRGVTLLLEESRSLAR